MTIYKEKGKTGRVYHVLEPEEDMLKYMIKAAKYHKTSAKNIKAINVYIKDDGLYLEAVEGARKAIAIIRR